jgi:uncharacterized protein (TIGR03000 family)
MKFHRFVWALLLATIVLGSLEITEANAFARRIYVAPEPAYYPLEPMPYHYNSYVMPYYYNPYVMPLPGYGILPLPPALLGPRSVFDAPQRTAEDYGYRLDTPARKRPGLYPAVPFEKSPEDRLADLRRVRYEITVPFADATLLIDGSKTKQTGLNRVFVTPPMQEDKVYTVTITVEWSEKDGTARKREKTFTVVAGETVRHTFIE